MNTIRKNFNFSVAAIICMAAVSYLFVACEDEVDKNTKALAGTWTSISVTGTVTYSSSSLTATVNGKMTSYDLKDMVVLEFDSEGNASVFPNFYSYTFKDGVLKLTPLPNGKSDSYKVEVNGNEFTLTHYGLFAGDVIGTIAWNIGNKELQANGQSMSQAGVSITAADLVIKFRKTKF